MTDGHRRHLAATVRYIGRLIEEAQRMVLLPAEAFGAIDDDLSDASRERLTAALHELGRDLLRFSQRFDLGLRGRPIPAMQAIGAQLSVVSIAIDEMRPRALRGYGELDGRTADDLDHACNDLDEAVTRARKALDRVQL